MWWRRKRRKKSKLPLVLSCLLLGILAAGYTGLCAYAANNGLPKNTRILGQDLSGLTVSQAAKKLERALPTMKIRLYAPADDGADGLPERAKSPDAHVAFGAGAEADPSILGSAAPMKDPAGQLFDAGLAVSHQYRRFLRRGGSDLPGRRKDARRSGSRGGGALLPQPGHLL